jgi:lysophospholipase L1-like esterase
MATLLPLPNPTVVGGKIVFLVPGTTAGTLHVVPVGAAQGVEATAFVPAKANALSDVQVLSDGDSKEGKGAGTGDPTDLGDFYADLRWTAELKNRLQTAAPGIYRDFRNYGVSGQTLSQMLSDYQAQVLLVRDAATYVSGQILIVGGFINGIGLTGSTAAAEYAKKKQYIQTAKAAGFLVLTMTETRVNDNEGSSVYTITQMNEQIALFNGMMRTKQDDMGYDGLLDFAADARFLYPALAGQPGSPYHDGIHMVALGNQIKADITLPVIQAVAQFGKQAYNPNALLGGVRRPVVWKPNANITIVGNCFTNTGGGGTQFDVGSSDSMGMGQTSATVRGRAGFMARRTGNSTLFGLRAGSALSYGTGNISGMIGAGAATLYMEDSSSQGQLSWFINGTQSAPITYSDGDWLEIENQKDKVVIYQNGNTVDTVAYTLPDNCHVEAMVARQNTGITDAYCMATNAVGL